MTFFDYHSTKNILRQLRNSKPKLTMTLSQIASVAAAHGAKLLSCPGCLSLAPAIVMP